MNAIRIAAAGVCGTLCAASLFAQGLTTNAKPADWEEINFEFNSAILSDGYPSLLRLAELLSQHRDFHVRVTGHTDYVGSAAYNDKLALARANTVRDFLVKYGGSTGQITTEGDGKRNPEVGNGSKEGRFINRRVTLTVTDATGKVVGDGGVGQAINAFEEFMKKQEECCSNILKRLDKLDDILAALRDLKGENDKLRAELNDVKGAQQKLQDQVNGLPRPLNTEQTTQIARAENERALEEAQRRNRKFSLLGLNVGPTYGGGRTGDFTFSGSGRYFSPFGGSGTHAVQAQAEYMYYPGRQEGQFDIGLVQRMNRLQMGLFSSFKYVNWREFRSGGTLGQGAFTLDYIFSRGRVGLFGTKGFKDNPVVNRIQLGPSSWVETYLHIVDQAGVSAQVGIIKNAYLEGNIGYLRSYGHADRPGGRLKLVSPLNDRFAVTAEVGLNETFLNTKNSGRVTFGFEFGNWLRPKDYTSFNHPVPVDVPRVRYEMLTRRIGNSPPVADAGPDQSGVAAGLITLDGSASYDPEGDPLKYQWTQIFGQNVAVSGANGAQASFTAAEGQSYTFRLTVTDPGGMSSSARVTISTLAAPQIRILRFDATPNTIQPGGTANLAWVVEGADTVSITPGPGNVDAHQGRLDVSPTSTTQYTLTARARDRQITSTATVTVSASLGARIIRFEATPTNIQPGEAATLSWTTQDATQVTIEGIGAVDPNGSRVVTPPQTTTYTLTARGADGRSVTAPVVVTVGAGGGARILRFSGTPTEVGPGEAVSLCWQVEGVSNVAIAPGTFTSTNGSGCTTVNPQQTTTYTLTAGTGSTAITATAVISVVSQVRILTFTANPPQVTNAGATTLTWTTENATSVVITGNGAPNGNQAANGSVAVKPAADTTYTLIAYGQRSQVSAVLLVRVNASGTTGGGPLADAGPNQSVYVPIAYIDASNSKSADGSPLTYSWRVAGLKLADIDDPTSARTRVVLKGSFGEYVFEVTVTDKNGNRATAQTRVNFVDP